MPAMTAGGTHSEANRRGMDAKLNEPKTTHNTINRTIPSSAKPAPTMPARVRFRPFNGEGEFVISSPNESCFIIAKMDY